MKSLLSCGFLFIFVFSLFSCDKDEKENVYATKFHYYSWDADTVPLTVPAHASEQTFHLKDFNGYPGGIIGVPSTEARDRTDSITRIYNTALKPVYVEETGATNYINSIISDTIRGKWFTVINEEQKQLRVILDKNEETETRTLAIAVWTSGNPLFTDNGHPTCDPLVIYQQPEKANKYDGNSNPPEWD